MKSVSLAVAILLAFLLPVQAAPKLSAADKAWIEKCAGRLAEEGPKRLRSARAYCACMHEQVEDNADMTQMQMERSWPPVHLFCRKQAGWR